MSTIDTENRSEISVTREFWQYVLPTVGAMMVSALYQIIDGIFIGRFIGADGLAAINLVWPIIGSLYGLGMMTGVGSGAISSMARGEKNYKRARLATGNAFFLLLVIGVLGSLALFISGEFLLRLQDADGAAMGYASHYLQIVVFGSPFVLGSLALPFMVRNDQSPTLSTWMIVVGAVSNIILNAIFIIYLEMGLTGAALGTTLSQGIVTVIGIAYFCSSRSSAQLTIKAILPNVRLSLQISSIGLSSLLMYSYFSFIVAIHNYLFIQYGSSTTVGAFAVVGYIATLYYMFAEGVAAGTQPLISYNYGAHAYQRMKQFVNLMLRVAVGSGILSVLLINIFADPVVNIFNATDPAFFAEAKLGLRLHLAAMYLDGLIFCAGVFFQSIGISRKATFITMANMLIQLPFLLILPRLIGVNGVWLAMPLSNIALSLIVIWMMWQQWRSLEGTMKNGQGPGAFYASKA